MLQRETWDGKIQVQTIPFEDLMEGLQRRGWEHAARSAEVWEHFLDEYRFHRMEREGLLHEIEECRKQLKESERRDQELKAKERKLEKEDQKLREEWKRWMDEKKSTRRQMDDMSRELRELQDENTELKVKLRRAGIEEDSPPISPIMPTASPLVTLPQRPPDSDLGRRPHQDLGDWCDSFHSSLNSYAPEFVPHMFQSQ
ncbi:unnamed protein product [Durusdinium trenchii]|uniref:Uncharacterized protein n=2 Tax=Durusdinium trenchii TaxID=1381693 RepID=A0ABP0NWM9_9DINO